jgi:predicted ribosomally synthesized peptide with SipW-like signal peptide
MKKIILSLAVIAVVAVVAVGATRAFFSDTLTSTGNTFTAGTIDIAVGESGFVPVNLIDMKPSQVAYSNFTVQNTGTNPVNVTKTLQNIVTSENGVNEPECSAYGGVWTPTNESANHCVGGQVRNDIDTVVQYDLSVKVYKPDGTLVWNQTLNDMDKTVAEKNNQPSFLGMIPAGYHMDVVESYHMASSTGNWAQSDSMKFDILLTGTQLTGTATLSDKNPDRPVKDGWFVLGTKTGTLTYGVKDDAFNYTFTTTGLGAVPGTSYSLIDYVDPYPGNGTGSVGLIGSGLANASGEVILSGNPDFNKDMINAKVWLVPSASYDAGSKSIIGWAPSTYLFDTGLIDYYDSVK